MYLEIAKLHFQYGTHDKVYHACIETTDDINYSVLFAYGKRGNNDKLVNGKKIVNVHKYAALSTFRTLINSKLNKGYRHST